MIFKRKKRKVISNACFISFAACWAIACYSVVVLWHPGVMPVFFCLWRGYVCFLDGVCRFVCVGVRWGVCWVTVMCGHSRVLWFACFRKCRSRCCLLSSAHRRSHAATHQGFWVSELVSFNYFCFIVIVRI